MQCNFQRDLHNFKESLKQQTVKMIFALRLAKVGCLGLPV